MKASVRKSNLICIVFACQFFCTAVLSVTVGEEEDIIGKTPHGRILFDKVMVLQFGIQGIPSSRSQILQFSLLEQDEPNKTGNCWPHAALDIYLRHREPRLFQALHQ